MEKILINATQAEEVRVALVKDNYLYDLDIECPTEIKKKGNIYKAIVTRCEPSLDAVFVEYGSKKQGFLPLKEIAPENFKKLPGEIGEEKVPINNLIQDGQELLVQIDKEERGNKGAALTTYITLAGCYLVLMPNSPNAGGISRRIEGEERDELKETLNALNLADNAGIIIRTAGVGKSQEELQADLDMLCNQWQAIKQSYANQLGPSLIHQEGDVIIRSIRDNLRKSIDEIIIDDQVSYVKAKRYIEQVKPDFLPNLKFYNSTIPLFNFYQIESQIETAYHREVSLPSGGSVVIDRTEALVSIDINSAKSTSGVDIETTALNTNLEAANEIARQLRLRDLGGLVVIDFIDMVSSKNQREVERCLKEALKADRARIQVGRISRFGLLEMSRQRLRLSLGESAQKICPRCEGRGTVRSIQSHGLSIIRLIEEEALKKDVKEIQVQLPPEMATFLINEKRSFILNIEKRHDVKILIIANPYLQLPHYEMYCSKEEPNKSILPSYTFIHAPDLVPVRSKNVDKLSQPDELAMSHHEKTESINIIKRLWKKLFGSSELEMPQAADTTIISNKISANKQEAASPRTHGKQQGHSSHKRRESSQHKTSHSNRGRKPRASSGRITPMKSEQAKRKATINKE